MTMIRVVLENKGRAIIAIDGTSVAGMLSIKDLVKEQIKNNEVRIKLLEDVLTGEIPEDL
jgi:hypothetical protein